MFAISSEPIVQGSDFCDASSGALVTFEGRVRDVNDGRRVKLLEYEAYEILAEKEGLRIIEEALLRFQIVGARCVHRVGMLAIGEVAIRVEVLAGHRKPAFEACEFIVNEVKSRVPIWKREHYADRESEWINASASDATAAHSIQHD